MDKLISSSPGKVKNVHREGEGADADAEDLVNTFSERFKEAMDDDFNSALAIASFFDTVRGLNRWINDADFISSKSSLEILKEAREALVECGSVLGILESSPAKFLSTLTKKRTKNHQLDTREIEDLVAQRWEARKAKEWAKSDEIRDLLASKGVILKDSQEGTTWEVKA